MTVDGAGLKIPTSAEEVTPEFLTAVLRPCFPGVDIRWCRRELLTGEQGMSGAGLLRVHLGGVGAVLPTTVIVKLPPADPAARAQLTAMGFFEREVRFYRTLAVRTPIDVAKCYAAEYEPETGSAFVILEDLADARNASSVAGLTIDELIGVLLALARMHARWWEDATVADLPWLRLRSMLAPSSVAEVFEQAWPRFLTRLSIPVGDEILRMKSWISGTLQQASATLYASPPRTLIHNDVQADNLFFLADPGRPVVFVDWQMMTYGRCVVDVANAIRGSLQPDLRRRVEADLLRVYHEALVRAGVRNYPFAQCRADYDLAAVLSPGRLASAVGVIPDLAAHPGAAWDTLFPRFKPDRGDL
jgi:hypothetical protein